jgi:myosin-5
MPLLRRFPRATDATLHTQLLDALVPPEAKAGRTGPPGGPGGASASGQGPVFWSNPRVPGSFCVRHYAGAVQYDCGGLLDKNKDALGPGVATGGAAAGAPAGHCRWRPAAHAPPPLGRLCGPSAADLVGLMTASSRPLLAELGGAVSEEAERSAKKGQTVRGRRGAPHGALLAPAPHM